MKNLRPIGLVAAVASLMLWTACTKKSAINHKRAKNTPTTEVGTGLPEIGQTKNDTVSITLAPSAQYFFIDLGLKQSAKNIELIKSANKLDIPVRAKVFKDNPHEIAEIYAATAGDITNYQKAKGK